MMKRQESRPIKELLQLMLDSEHLFLTGLCPMAFNMVAGWKGAAGWLGQFSEMPPDVVMDNGVITLGEGILIMQYIRRHKPFMAYFWVWLTRGYYWPSGKWEPREKWLKKQIKKLSK